MNSTRVTKLLKQNTLSFSKIEIEKPLRASACLVGKVQVQNPTLVNDKNQTPHHT